MIQRPFDRSDESRFQSRSKSSEFNFKTIYIVESYIILNREIQADKS